MPDSDATSAASARELAALCTHLQGDAERKKADLARRLHDELGGLLTAAKMDFSWLQSRIEDPTLRQRLTQLGSALDEAMNLKRRVVEELRPSLLDHFGLPTALRAHVQSTCDAAGIDCEVAFAEAMDSIPTEHGISLFRVIQAGLDNIVQHAGAKNVRIELMIDAARYVLRLRDDGRGIDLSKAAAAASHGLVDMRHRVEGMGGTLTLESGPGRGTTLTVSVPRQP